MVRVRVKWAACNVYVGNCVKREVVTERYNLGTYSYSSTFRAILSIQ